MGLFKRKQAREADPKVIRRLLSLSTPELIPWAETSLHDAGRMLDAYRKSGDLADLDLADEAYDVLGHLLDEIRRRAVIDAVAPHASLR